MLQGFWNALGTVVGLERLAGLGKLLSILIVSDYCYGCVTFEYVGE